MIEKDNKQLFRMNEVIKAVGITRRILINYEEHGLVEPATARNEHGFRYYTADNIVHIRLIRTLQNLGLSLEEIREYFDDSGELDAQIDRLTQLRNRIDRYIAHLRLRQANLAEQEVLQVSLPEFRAFCRPFHEKTLAQKPQSCGSAISKRSQTTAWISKTKCVFKCRLTSRTAVCMSFRSQQRVKAAKSNSFRRLHLRFASTTAVHMKIFRRCMRNYSPMQSSIG